MCHRVRSGVRNAAAFEEKDAEGLGERGGEWTSRRSSADDYLVVVILRREIGCVRHESHEIGICKRKTHKIDHRYLHESNYIDVRGKAKIFPENSGETYVD